MYVHSVSIIFIISVFEMIQKSTVFLIEFEKKMSSFEASYRTCQKLLFWTTLYNDIDWLLEWIT